MAPLKATHEVTVRVRMPDYPLRFHPVYQERLWGGDLHLRVLGAPVLADVRIGESWEITDRPEAMSRVANGPLAGASLRELIEAFPGALIGPNGRPEQRFPLLIKFIGARDRLSLQVHPGDVQARDRPDGDPGKTELWYVLEADPGAEMCIGFRTPQTPAGVREALQQDRFGALVNAAPARSGDAFFVPAGRVHGIGAGIFLAEIGENSDRTFRVYDHARRDEQGRPRDLHIPQALEVLDLADTSDGRILTSTSREGGVARRALAEDPHFMVEHLHCDAQAAGPVQAEAQVLVVTEGEGELGHAQGVDRLTRGAVRLLPAGFSGWGLIPGAAGLGLLRAWVPDARP